MDGNSCQLSLWQEAAHAAWCAEGSRSQPLQQNSRSGRLDYSVCLCVETLAVLVFKLFGGSNFWLPLRCFVTVLCLLYCRINLYLPKLRCNNHVKPLCMPCLWIVSQADTFVNNSSKIMYLKQFLHIHYVKKVIFLKQFLNSCLYIKRGCFEASFCVSYAVTW